MGVGIIGNGAVVPIGTFDATATSLEMDQEIGGFDDMDATVLADLGQQFQALVPPVWTTRPDLTRVPEGLDLSLLAVEAPRSDASGSMYAAQGVDVAVRGAGSSRIPEVTMQAAKRKSYRVKKGKDAAGSMKRFTRDVNAALEKGDAVEAERLVRKAIGRGVSRADGLMMKLIQHFKRQGDAEGQRRWIAEFARLWPNSRDAKRMKVQVLETTGTPKELFEHYRDTLLADPTDTDAVQKFIASAEQQVGVEWIFNLLNNPELGQNPDLAEWLINKAWSIRDALRENARQHVSFHSFGRRSPSSAERKVQEIEESAASFFGSVVERYPHCFESIKRMAKIMTRHKDDGFVINELRRNRSSELRDFGLWLLCVRRDFLPQGGGNAAVRLWYRFPLDADFEASVVQHLKHDDIHISRYAWYTEACNEAVAQVASATDRERGVRLDRARAIIDMQRRVKKSDWHVDHFIDPRVRLLPYEVGQADRTAAAVADLTAVFQGIKKGSFQGELLASWVTDFRERMSNAVDPTQRQVVAVVVTVLIKAGWIEQASSLLTLKVLDAAILDPALGIPVALYFCRTSDWEKALAMATSLRDQKGTLPVIEAMELAEALHRKGQEYHKFMSQWPQAEAFYRAALGVLDRLLDGSQKTLQRQDVLKQDIERDLAGVQKQSRNKS